MAARDLGIEYPRVEYEGDDPLGYVISLNLKRRHLSESQRGMVAAKLAKLPQGARTDLEPRANLHEVSAAQAAQMLSVSERTVKAAKAVQRTAVPEIVAAVEAGQLAVSTAAEIAREPVGVQQEIVARGPAEIKSAYKAIRATELEAARTARIEKIEAISAGRGIGLSYWLTTKPGGGGGIFSFAAEPDKSG